MCHVVYQFELDIVGPVDTVYHKCSDDLFNSENYSDYRHAYVLSD